MTPMSREEQILSLLTAWSEKNYTPPLDINDLYDLVEPISDLLAQARAEGAVEALTNIKIDAMNLALKVGPDTHPSGVAIRLNERIDHLITRYQTKEEE